MLLPPPLNGGGGDEKFKIGDINNMKKVVNKFIFADQLEKPKDLIKIRSRNKGGLQLHNIDCKSLAMQIKTFLELSTSTKFRTSPYYKAIDEVNILDNDAITNPGYPPFYTQHFFDTIKAARKDGMVESWSSRQWYQFLLERNVLCSEAANENGIMRWVPLKCQVEIDHE